MITIDGKDISAIVIDNKEVIRISDYLTSETMWEKIFANYFYVLNTYNGTNTISIKQSLVGSPDSTAYAKHLQYSKDGLNWTTIALSSTAYTISLLKGEKVFFRGNEGVFNYWASGGAYKAITNISANQTHIIGGDVNTLLNYNNTQGLTLPQGAFNSIFDNDTKLTSASDVTLQSSTDGSLPSFCYLYMFNGCSSLTTPPQSIPATIQGQAACQGMFQDCTHLTIAPELPATTLANYCYNAIFQGCSALTTAPTLPATTIGQYSYRYAFRDCTSLTTAPELPATTLANYCYQSMFQGCSALTTAPELPTKTLVDYCYQQMFRNCTHLNKVTIYADNNSASNCINNWLYGVAASGTFNNYGTATYQTNSASGIPTGWTLIDYNDYFHIQNTYSGSNTITLTTTKTGTPQTGTYATSVQYSKDKSTWTTLSLSAGATNTISLNQGEKIYFRNNSGYFNYTDDSNNYYTAITGSKSHKLGGNINTLLDYTDLSNVSLNQGCFSRMFLNDIELVDASDLELPSTTLANYCYHSMFKGCTSLTSAPELPATSVISRCYQEMFYGCTALTTAPELPATTATGSYVYQAMFRDCTSLTTPPSVIPLTIARFQCCQRMFSDCTALTTAPELPATTVETGCYQYMFLNCTSLTTAPSELPATVLAQNCYYEMFGGCKLTSSPIIKAKTLAKQSCTVMFRNCTHLNNVTIYADDNSAENCTDRWLYNVAATGTLNNYGTATYPTNSASGIPTGWNQVSGIDYFYIENKNSGSNTVDINTSSQSPTSNNYATSLQYSKDKTNWTTISLDGTEHSISLNQGEKVYFRNGSGYFNWCDSMILRYVHTYFNCWSKFAVGGNVMSLIDFNNMFTAQVSDGCFNNLFKYSSTLTDSSNLIMPNRTSQNCFREMFKNCNGMTTGPQSLPALNLSEDCYTSMFEQCTKLTSTPTLPATNLAPHCYYSMFNYCSNLTSTSTLPATTLAEGCYSYMFYSCSLLTTAPALPATTLTDECYKHMFNGCTRLNTMTVSANNISAYNCIYRWLYNAGTGTFHNLGSATYSRDNETGIPSGWTIVNS